MRRMFVVGLLGLVCLALLASLMPAKALVMAPSPLPDRVLNAQIIVVGKVTAIEEKTVKAAPAPGAAPVDYQIAVVKIDEAVLGAKGLTHVRVGFIPPPVAPVRPGDPTIVPPIRRYPSVNLTKDQEVLLFLQPLGKESFFVAPMYFDVIDKKTPNFAKEVETIKRSVKLLADPKAGLKSKDESDRLLASSLLLSKYRTAKGPIKGVPKQEPIDAEESKLILLALAEADWNKPATINEPSPRMLFQRLGVTEKDGFKPPPPKEAKQYPELAKKWLKENAEKYRIQRYVPEAAEK